MNNIKNYRLIELFVTCFNVGKIKFAPGTWGSIMAYPLLFILGMILVIISIFFKFLQNPYIISTILFIILCIIFFIGCKYSEIYSNYNNIADPKEIVIDEVVGQGLVLVAIFPINLPFLKIYSPLEYCFYIFLLPFILFRLLDIVKPWPISWFDKNIKGGIGVMLDDVVAAIIAIIIYYNIFFLRT